MREKRDLENFGYKNSRLWLNKYLSTVEKWNKEEIEKRFKIIEERFLNIWKIPNIDFEDEYKQDAINIFDAESPKGKKLEYIIYHLLFIILLQGFFVIFSNV